METLRHLRHVLALAEHRHFGRAAEAEGITQAALTISIQRVEEIYGAQLFSRVRGQTEPTVFGEAVIATARTTLTQLSHLRREIDSLKSFETTRLIIGVDAYFSEAIVAPALTRLIQEHRRLQFNMEIGPWELMKRALLAKEVDLYVGFPQRFSDPGIQQVSYLLPPWTVFCRAGHPLAGRHDVSVDDIFSYPVVAPRAPPWLLSWFEGQLGERGRSVRSQFPAFLLTSDFAAIRQIVRESDAISAAMGQTVAPEMTRGDFMAIDVRGFDFEMPLVVASLQNRVTSPAVEAILGRIDEQVLAVGGRQTPER